jgi:hypothetical protein
MSAAENGRASALTHALEKLPRLRGDRQDRVRDVIARITEFAQTYRIARPSNFKPDLGLPVDRLLNEVLFDLGAKALAALPDRKPIVFSSSPNKDQRALPREASRAVAQALEDRKEIFVNRSAVDAATAGSSVADWVTERIKSYGENLSIDSILLGGVRNDDNWYFSLGLYDKDGRIVDSAHISLAPKYEGSIPFVDKSKPAVLSQDEARLLVTGSCDGFARKFLELEPLSLGVTSALASYARDSQCRLAALLDDRLLPLAKTHVRGNALELSSFLRDAVSQGLLTFNLKDETIIIKPAAGVCPENRRLDRGELRKLIALPSITLQDFAEFARKTGLSPQSSSLLKWIILAAESNGVSVSTVQREPEQALLALGEILPMCNASSVSKWRFPAPSLSARVKANIRDWAANGLVTLHAAGLSEWELHGTNVLKGGFPNDAALEVEVQDNDVLAKPTAGGSFFQYPHAAEEIRQYLRDVSGVTDPALVLSGHVLFGKTAKWQLKLALPNGQEMSASFADIPRLAPMRYLDVPKSFRDKLSG